MNLKKLRNKERIQSESARSGTLCIIANGQNLNMDDVLAVVDSGMVVWVVSDAYRLVPGAALLYSSDDPWWTHHLNKVVDAGFTGEMITQEASTAARYYKDGLRLVPHAGAVKTVVDGFVSGSSSGHHALSLAAQRDFERIILLGYEYGGSSHWFGSHPPEVARPSAWSHMIRDMPPLAYSVADRGVTVINCTKPTALTCFLAGELKDELELYQRNREETRPVSRHEAE